MACFSVIIFTVFSEKLSLIYSTRYRGTAKEKEERGEETESAKPQVNWFFQRG